MSSLCLIPNIHWRLGFASIKIDVPFLIADSCFTALGSPRPHLEATKCFGADLSSLAGFNADEVLVRALVVKVT